MKTLRIALFILLALAQLAVPASMIWKRQHTLREGRLWKFRTAPVDPVDAVRGRYLALRFEAEDFSYDGALPFGETAYVTLKEDADGFAAVDRISREPTKADNVVQVDRFGFYDKKAHVSFPFDTFWVSEANAHAAENAFAAHSHRGTGGAYATVRIRQSDAAIEDLYVAGKPLRDYLRGR